MLEIETQRTLLRSFTLADVPALHKINSNPKVMQYLGYIEHNEEQTRQYLLNGPLLDYQKYGFGRHACIHKASGELIGFSGLKYMTNLDEVDIGYRLLPEYWGMGLATETSLALMDYAKTDLKLSRIIGLAVPQNLASIKVFPKIGMSYERNIMLKHEECVLWSWQKHTNSD